MIFLTGLLLCGLYSCADNKEDFKLDAIYQEYENGNFEDCISMLSNVELENHEDSLAYFKLQGLCLFELNQFEEALVMLEKIDTEVGADPDFWIVLGRIYDTIGSIEKAQLSYSKAIDIDTENSTVFNSRGLVYARLGDFSLAILDFERAINLDPSNSKAYNNLGLVYEHTQDYDSAIICYTKSIELDRTEHVVFYNRGVSFMYLDYFNEAIKDFSQAISIKNDVGLYYHNRAMAYYLFGEKSKACSDWESASELGEKEATNFITKYCYPSI